MNVSLLSLKQTGGARMSQKSAHITKAQKASIVTNRHITIPVTIPIMPKKLEMLEIMCSKLLGGFRFMSHCHVLNVGGG
jgi:hypothetical protein